MKNKIFDVFQDKEKCFAMKNAAERYATKIFSYEDIARRSIEK